MGSLTEPGMAPAWKGEFFDFWPVTIVRRVLPDSQARNAQIVALAKEMESGNPNLTTNYQGVDFFRIERPEVQWLRGHIDRTMVAYLAHHDMRYPVRWSLQGWPNINRLGDYHAPHNHGWCYLSGTYYVQMPPDSPEEAVPAGARPGCISFHDPRSTVNMIAGNPAASSAEFAIRPEAGTLLMWHAAVNHFVHPNFSATERVSVSFNVVLEWANHYLANA